MLAKKDPPKIQKVTYKVRAEPVERKKDLDLRLTKNSENKLVTTDAPPERKTFKQFLANKKPQKVKVSKKVSDEIKSQKSKI